MRSWHRRVAEIKEVRNSDFEVWQSWLWEKQLWHHKNFKISFLDFIWRAADKQPTSASTCQAFSRWHARRIQIIASPRARRLTLTTSSNLVG